MPWGGEGVFPFSGLAVVSYVGIHQLEWYTISQQYALMFLDWYTPLITPDCIIKLASLAGLFSYIVYVYQINQLLTFLI